ncbi:MAG: HAMP domain-containing protein [Planctomycetes bacterium]|nr:HAMP domain-containing protein [Planctomycetota bacterium]
MNILNNMKIKNKLIVMIIFPVLGLLYFSITELINKVFILKEMDSVLVLSDFSVRISGVIHELQKERGRTGPFLLSGGETFADELKSQRSVVDDKWSAMRNDLETQRFGKFKNNMGEAISLISSLNGKRETIDALKITREESFDFYNGVVENLMDVINSLAAISTNANVANQLIAYQALIQTKEHVGLKREILGSVFYLNIFNEELKKVYYATLESEGTHTRQFFSHATPAQRDFFRNKMNSDAVREVARIQKLAEKKISEGNFGIESAYWFTTATGVIDILKEIEDEVYGNLNECANNLWSGAQLDVIIYSIIIFVSLLFTFLLVFYITRRITVQVKNLVNTMNILARGELSKRVVIESHDEIGKLGIVFNDMGQKIQDSAERERREAEELREKVEKFRNGVEKIATGDLTLRFDVMDGNTLSQLGGHLNSMVESLAGMASQITEASASMNVTITEVQSAVNLQSSGASQQAASINETTSTLEEIRATSRQTQEKAEVLGEAAERTRQEGENGMHAVAETISAMQSIREKVETIAENILALSEQTQQIGEITSTVNNLAQQLKMLSLNASIEANKAGEAGRGFAVVAAEVKDLAEQSQQATAQVHKILQDIQRATEKAVMVTEEGTKGVDHGVQLVEQTGNTVKNLTEVIEETALAGQQIVAAVRQGAVGIDQIFTAMSDINKAVAQFVVSTKQTKEAANHLVEISSQLNAKASLYKY